MKRIEINHKPLRLAMSHRNTVSRLLFLVVLLLLSLSGTVMFAQALHYQVETEGCSSSYTTVIGVLMIDNEEVFNGNLEIGVFDQDGICRGANLPTWRSNSNKWIYTLILRGNEGFEYPTFKIYDHGSDTELEDLVLDIKETIRWSPDKSYGSSSDPYSINFKTYTKEIIGYGYGEGNNHWYLIASPIGEVNPNDVHFMITDDPDSYDLYRFNQSAELEWENWKAEDDHNQFPLELGRGYLYANSEDVTLTFNGTPYDGDGIIELTKSDGAHFAGWNLIGNPFSGTAYINREFYVMNEQGSEIVPAERDYIESMEGVFVVAEEDGETVTFSTEAPSARSASLALNLSRGSVAPSSTRGTIDRVIVRFGEGRMLPKFQLNPSHTKVYIPMDGKDYAVVRSEGLGEMPVNFKADANGSYTLSVSTEEVSLNYLHLIDSKTGNDIDLLKTPDYTFEASTTDDASRFKMVFAQEGNTKTNTLADVKRSPTRSMVDMPILPCHGEVVNQPAWEKEVEVTITMNEYGIMTYASPYALDFSGISGLTAFYASDFTSNNDKTGTLTLTAVPEQVAPAGVGLLLKGTKNETYTVPIADNATALDPANLMVGLTTATPVSKKQTINNEKYTSFILANGNSGINWYVLGEDSYTLRANSAYLRLLSSDVFGTDGQARQIVMNYDEASGISDVVRDMRSGDDSWCTVDGVKLGQKPTRKGLYIVNGTVVVIK